MKTAGQLIEQLPKSTQPQATGELRWPQPCRELVDWFFAELRILVGIGSFERAFPDEEAERAGRLKWSREILGDQLYAACFEKAVFKDVNGKKTENSEILAQRKAQLDRALVWIRRSGGMDFLNVGKVLAAIEKSRKPAAHKPFNRSRALEKLPLDNETNKSRMAELRSQVGL
ncbi:MAG: hypothetical protein ACPGVN_08205 [Alphaproteobacteria bacterium]